MIAVTSIDSDELIAAGPTASSVIEEMYEKSLMTLTEKNSANTKFSLIKKGRLKTLQKKYKVDFNYAPPSANNAAMYHAVRCLHSIVDEIKWDVFSSCSNISFDTELKKYSLTDVGMDIARSNLEHSRSNLSKQDVNPYSLPDNFGEYRNTPRKYFLKNGQWRNIGTGIEIPALIDGGVNIQSEFDTSKLGNATAIYLVVDFDGNLSVEPYGGCSDPVEIYSGEPDKAAEYYETKADLLILRKRVTEIEAESASRKVKSEYLEKEVLDLKEENSNLKDRVSSLEDEVRELKWRITEITERYSEIEEK